LEIDSRFSRQSLERRIADAALAVAALGEQRNRSCAEPVLFAGRRELTGPLEPGARSRQRNFDIGRSAVDPYEDALAFLIKQQYAHTQLAIGPVVTRHRPSVRLEPRRIDLPIGIRPTGQEALAG